MSYTVSNGNTSSAYPNASLGAAGAGFGTRGTRFNSKQLSVNLTDVAHSSENAGVPTPRTSRSHLLAGLRTQPKTPGNVAPAAYHQTQQPVNGLGVSRWADANAFHNNGTSVDYTQHAAQSSAANGFDMSAQQQQAAAMRAGQQMYALPEQVLAPPSLYEQNVDMDPNLLQQLQMTSVFLAQRQQQLQQKLAALSFQEQNIVNQPAPTQQFLQPQAAQAIYYQQQQMQQAQQHQPVEVQPGVYLVFNPATQNYTYVYDQSAQLTPEQEETAFHPTPVERTRSFTPPKKSLSPPFVHEPVEPLPPPSANAFRRGHKKSGSLAINPDLAANEGPKTSSAASFGTQRSVLPQPPMTGTFGPGSARAGEHPMRQPRGPPPLEELTVAPTTKHEGSKNFATRQRRRALDSLVRAGSQRRDASRSSGGSPISERGSHFSRRKDILSEELSFGPSSTIGSRKMSPIGHEMKQKRGSSGSNDGYFSLSSASSSECDDSTFKQPLTPATPIESAPTSLGGDQRKKMMMGVLNAAEKRKSTFM